MRTIVKTENVKKFYEQTKALQGVSITVHANDFIAVLGKSGSGIRADWRQRKQAQRCR